MTRLHDPISCAALAYLAIPAFIFVCGWMEPPFALTISVVLAVALYRLNLQLPERPFEYSAPALITLLILACLWAAFSGGAHLFYANTDWRTRDAVYADLILSSWPPAYGLSDGAPIVLRTAFGYFLPPAWLSHLAGIVWAPTILACWTALGVLLFLLLLPLPRQLGWRLPVMVLLVAFFSGMDYPAIVLVHGHTPIFPLPLEWWRKWTYTSLSGQLLWAPNHALALWLGTGLFYRHRADPMLPALGLVLLPLLLLWTPFAVIGLLPWFAWSITRLGIPLRSMLRSSTKAQWLTAICLSGAVAGLFTRPSITAHSLPLVQPTTGNVPASAAAYIDWASSYIQFIAFEFAILALLLRPRLAETRQALALAVGILMLLPMIRLGPSNDWLLRVSTPSLLILLLLTLAEFESPITDLRRSIRMVSLAGVLMLGAITPGFEFSRSILWPRTPPNFGQSLVEQQGGFMAPNYFGLLDHAFLQALFKAPSRVPDGPTRQNLLPASMHRPP
ncbi:MAG: Uncharacterized protein FD157_103 [Rhodocyclaceae bacterium]|nr:MAG: Uncharacterized protein FD157_103 [Rhodocyclaceae bacterium]TND04921.1 MAG: Uncharacterized protein FD118_740 [Rhodocyclaceae bacterium]